MNRYFTHYWKNDTCLEHEPQTGELLEHIASNLFRERGVSEGDVVYPVTVRNGRLVLIGRLLVNLVCNQADAARILQNDNLWPAEEHIIATAATSMRFDIEVPTETVESLLFVAAPHSKGLRFSEPGHLDQQTLRGVRELEQMSARAFDELLPENTPIQRSSVVM